MAAVEEVYLFNRDYFRSDNNDVPVSNVKKVKEPNIIVEIFVCLWEGIKIMYK